MTMNCFPLLQSHTKLIGFQNTVYKVKVNYDTELFQGNHVSFSESEAHDEIEQVFRAVLYIDKHDGDIKPIVTKHFVIRTKKVPWDFVSKYRDYVFRKREEIYETCKFVFLFDISPRKSVDSVEQNHLVTRKTLKKTDGTGKSGIPNDIITKERHLNERRIDARHSKEIRSEERCLKTRSKSSVIKQTEDVRRLPGDQTGSVCLRHRPAGINYTEDDSDSNTEQDHDDDTDTGQSKEIRSEERCQRTHSKSSVIKQTEDVRRLPGDQAGSVRLRHRPAGISYTEEDSEGSTEEDQEDNTDTGQSKEIRSEERHSKKIRSEESRRRTHSKSSVIKHTEDVRRLPGDQAGSVHLRHRPAGISYTEEDSEGSTEEDQEDDRVTKKIVLRTKQKATVPKRKEQSARLTTYNATNKNNIKAASSTQNNRTNKRLSTTNDSEMHRKSKRLENQHILSPIYPDVDTVNQSGETTEIFEDTQIGTPTLNTVGWNKGKHQRVRTTRSAKRSDEEMSSQTQDDSAEEFVPEAKKRRSARIASADSQSADSDRASINLPKKLPTNKPAGANAEMISSPRVSTVRPVKRDNSSQPQDSPAHRTRGRVMSPNREPDLASSSRQPRHMGPDEEARRIEMLRQERPTQVYRNVLLAQGRDRHAVEQAERAETDKLQQLYRPTQSTQQQVEQRASKRRSSGIWGVVMDKIVTPTRRYFSQKRS